MLVPLEKTIDPLKPEEAGVSTSQPVAMPRNTGIIKTAKSTLVPVKQDEPENSAQELPVPKTEPQDDISFARRNWGTGWRNVVGLGKGLKGLAQDFIGDEEGAKKTFEDYLKYEEETGRLNPAQIGTLKNIHGVGDAAQYIAETVLQQIPMIVPSIISGLIGAVAGTAVEPGGGTVAGGVAGLGIKSFGKKLVTRAIEKQVAKGIERKAAETIVRKQMGAMLGSFTSASAMNASEDYLELYKRTGEGHPLQAVSVGAVKGVLDTLPDIKPISKLMGISVRDFKKSAFKALGRYGDAFIGQAILEGPTEMAQYLLDEISVSAQLDKYDKTPDEIISEAVDNLVAGSIAGGVISVATEPFVRENVENKGKAPSVIPPMEAAIANQPAPSILPTEEELSAMEEQNAIQQEVQAEGPIGPVENLPVSQPLPVTNQQQITETTQADARPDTGDQSLIDETFSAKGVPRGTLRVVEQPADQRAELAQKIGAVIGKRVVFFEDTTERGYVLEGAPTEQAIFVNTKAKNPLQVVAIHEATHRMEREAPEVYSALESTILGAAKTEEGQSFQDFTAELLKIGPYSEPDAKREFVARVMGQRGTEGEFWDSMLKTGDRTAVEKFVEILTKIVDTIKAGIGLGTANTDTNRYLADVEKVRTAAVKALQDYAKTKEISAQPESAIAQSATAQPAIAPEQAAPVAEAVKQQSEPVPPTGTEKGAATLLPRTNIEREIQANIDALEKQAKPTDQRAFFAWRTAINESKKILDESLAVLEPTQADVDATKARWEKAKEQVESIRGDKKTKAQGEQSQLFDADKDLLQKGAELNKTATKKAVAPVKLLPRPRAVPASRQQDDFMQNLEAPIPVQPESEARGKGEYDSVRAVLNDINAKIRDLKRSGNRREAKLWAEARDALFAEKPGAHLDSWMQEKADATSSLIAPYLKGASDFDGLAKLAQKSAENYVKENIGKTKKGDALAAEIMHEAASRGVIHKPSDFKDISKEDAAQIKAIGKSAESPMFYTDPDTLRDVPVYKAGGKWRLQNASGDWLDISKGTDTHNHLETWVEAQNAPRAAEDLPFSAEPSQAEDEPNVQGLLQAKALASAAGLPVDYRANAKTRAENDRIGAATGWKKTPEGVWAKTEQTAQEETPLSAEPVMKQHMTAAKVEQNEKWSDAVRQAAQQAYYKTESNGSRRQRVTDLANKIGFDEMERAFENSKDIPDDLRTFAAALVAHAYQARLNKEIDPNQRVRIMNEQVDFNARVYKFLHDSAVSTQAAREFHTKTLENWDGVQWLMNKTFDDELKKAVTEEQAQEIEAVAKEAQDALADTKKKLEAALKENADWKEIHESDQRNIRDLKALNESAGNRAIAKFLATNDARLKNFSRSLDKYADTIIPRRRNVIGTAKENGFILPSDTTLAAEPAIPAARLNAFTYLTSQFILENSSNIGGTTFFEMREGDSLKAQWKKYAKKVFGDTIIPQLDSIWNGSKYEAVLAMNGATAKRKAAKQTSHKAMDKEPAPQPPALDIEQIAAMSGVSPAEVLTELQAVRDAKTDEARTAAKQKALAKLQKMADEAGITLEEAQVLMFEIARKNKAESLVDWAVSNKVTPEAVARKVAENNLTAWAKKQGLTAEQGRAELERMYNEAQFKDAEAARIFDMLEPTKRETRALTPHEQAQRQQSAIRRMGLLRYELSRMGTRISDLVKMNITDQSELRDTLINELVTAGVNASDAALITEKARAVWESMVEAQTAKMLEQAKNRKSKDVVEQIIAAMKSSRFSYAVGKRLFAQKYGLRAITPEFVQKMHELHANLQQKVELGGAADTTEADMAREAILTEMAKHFQRGIGENVWTFIYSQMLGKVPTHVFNLAVTGARFVVNQLLDPLHTGIIAGKQLLKGERQKAADTMLAQFRRLAMLKTAFEYGAAEAWHTLTTGRTPHDTVGKWENEYATISPAEYADFFNKGTFNPLRAIKYIQRALRAEDIFFRIPAAEQESYWQIFNEEQATGKTGNELFKAVDTRMGYNHALNKALYDDINARADKLNISGVNRKIFIHNEIRKQRGAEVNEGATSYSLAETFNDPHPYGLPGVVHNIITQGRGMPSVAGGTVRYFGLFSRVTANALNFVIESTPLQFFRLGADAIRNRGHYAAGEKNYIRWTPEQRARMAEKAAVGTFLAAYFISKAQDSYDDWKEKENEEGDPPFWFTAYGPRNPAIRQTWLKTHTPYSMRVGKRNIKIWMLGPAVGPALMAGAWLDAHRYADKDEKEENTIAKTLGITTLGIMQFLEDEMPAKNLADLIEVASSSEEGAWIRYARNQANSVVSLLMPIPFYGTVRDIDRGMIPGMGDPTVITDKLKPWYYGTLRNIPVIRNEMLTPARTVFGEPITREVWARFAEAPKNDPDINFLVLADKSFRAPPYKDTQVMQFVGDGMTARDSTPEEYDRFLVLFGAALRQEVATLRKTYSKREDFDKYSEQIKKRLNEARATAMRKARMQYYDETGTLIEQKPKE